MKIPYGTTREKVFLSGGFLLAAAASAAILLGEQMFVFPYLRLPLYLAVCALVLAWLPTGQLSGDPFSAGVYRVLPALVMMSAIFLASSFSLPSNPPVAAPDVPFHFAEFCALGLLTARMIAPKANRALSLRSCCLALLIVLGYALLDEFHQSFVPGRSPSWQDWFVDASGGFLGILVYPCLFTGPTTPSPPGPPG